MMNSSYDETGTLQGDLVEGAMASESNQIDYFLVPSITNYGNSG